jgi:anti-sigma regulatory factor (Ser/Thr protein kinase)
MAMTLLGTATLLGRPDQVVVARRFVAERLAGMAGADSAVLLASELVTNSVLHSRSAAGQVSVAVHVNEQAVRVEVIDEGGGEPAPRPVGPGSEEGHGLHIVAAVAKDWGTFIRPDARRCTWFTVTG